ncbi:cdc37 hsp90 binding domain-containing protein [Ditylenchus destructor]|nr:cdc37 hsp90 binding domain-containing protein [Ditylenchus destructor]
MPGIDYSKWKNIEVSDDEDDTHPNIDTPSLFRWRHQARLERMAEQKQAKEELEANKSSINNKIEEIEGKLNDASLEEKEEFLRKEKDLEEQERLQPWNVDTIGHEAWSKSIINKPKDKANIEELKEDEDEYHKKVLKYFEDNESLLKKFSSLSGFDQVEAFLLEHPHISSEYATNYLTIEALNLAIEEKHAKMNKMAENCITLQYLLELAKSLNAVATNTNVIKNFFKKIRQADVSYMKMYHDEVDAFKERLRKRAQEKREAAMTEAEAEAKAKRVAESPGGLDPQDVFESLPEAMQEAFQSQSMEKMYQVAETMDPEVFQHHLQRCIDSGLWIPNAAEKKAKEEAEAAKKKEVAENSS